MEYFVIIVNGFQLLTIITKRSTLDVAAAPDPPLDICRKTQALWTQLINHLKGHLNLQRITPQSVIFGFLDISDKDCLIVNHLLLLFKYYIYNARDRKHLVSEASMKSMKNIYDIA